ncbi:MAG: SIR2 family protein [Flavobacterium sp.]|uniref:SIR2 family protein n=1 Tax=Flavobacterium sp. TaxID=239 RepID=UPI00262DA600|nr:SIR2 family protein [Flavobacterium sp.]MDD5151105.1 SIR2 family protein [Flavobacterium sp.]
MSTGTHIPLFLFGNGLSMALSPEFSLKTITSKFIAGLEGDEKDYLCELCGGEENLSFDDFELNFSMIDDAYGNLRKYRKFIDSSAGKTLLNKFKLINPNLQQHEKIIKSLYDKYVFQILSLIHGNVTQKGIQEKLGGFTSFLSTQLNKSKKGYVFTLNYDLLAETILLENIGSDKLTDFCASANVFKGTGIRKFDFDPAMNESRHGEINIELHHLHGSLSLFYDYNRNKVIKFKSEDIFTNDIYNKIHDENWTLYPAIITGGGKSTKMTEYPFEFYHRNLKDNSTYVKYNKLFIVGYSFRDEHINELIKRWIDKVEDYNKGSLIVDYKSTESEQKDFMEMVKIQLKKKSFPSSCFEFRGVNFIYDIEGTIAKPMKK